MLIIYHCYGGTHSSVIASCIHVGLLPHNRIPSLEEIQNIPIFDRINSQNVGRIVFIGTDEYGNNVYSLGTKKAKNIVIPALYDLYYQIYKNTDELILVDTESSSNLFMKIGGFISITLKLPIIGRPLVSYGIKHSYNKLVQIVKNTKNKEKAVKSGKQN